MSSFDFNAGRRFREEGDIVEAIRCLKSAVEQDRDFIPAYIELGITYVVAFHESGDPLCLDSARNLCLAALRRDCPGEERQILMEMQDQVEGLIVESQKAAMDAMSDAIEGAPPGSDLIPDDEPMARVLDEVTDLYGMGPGSTDDEFGH
jgi:hypothetical protein